jgi:hypothetical protein
MKWKMEISKLEKRHCESFVARDRCSREAVGAGAEEGEEAEVSEEN